MQRMLIAVLTMLLFVLAACAQGTMQAQPLNITQPKGPCEDVVCGANMRCDAGACLCNSGFKQCGDGCISESRCCENSDCSADRMCQSGVCVERPVCGIDEMWDEDINECVCGEQAKYCAVQRKCIPGNHCCEHRDCGDDGQRCVDTSYSGSVCLRLGTKKCRVVHEGGIAQEFALPEGTYMIALKKVLQDGKFIVQVGNQTFRNAVIEERRQIDDNATFYVEDLREFGGYCREDED